MALRRCSLFLTVLLSACVQDATQPQPRKTLQPPIADDGWPTYNRTLDGQRYSPLKEITTANVARLQPVLWAPERENESSARTLAARGFDFVGSVFDRPRP